MVWYTVLLQFTYLYVGIVAFIFGFLLVYRNLRKINLIESEKFNLVDWVSCIAFGLMFALAIVFAVNLSVEVITPSLIPSIAGLVLLILIGILVVYPLWEIIFLGRPTSDSVHDVHKFLETKILDKFKGKIAYLVSLVIFLIMYILPIAVINQITKIDPFEVAFIWFLIFPLFFLAYYAALGQIGNVIGTFYSVNIPNGLLYGKKMSTSVISYKIRGFILFFIALIPLFTSIYGFYRPVSILIQGGIQQKQSYLGYISIFTTVVFGIYGFFSKFWNKKSKTRIVDFIFSGYIFIGIGVNMLISFLSINRTLIEQILNFSIFGVQPLARLEPLINNYAIILPVMMIQSAIIVFYGLFLILRTRSEIHADMRFSQVNKAFGFDIEKIVDRTIQNKPLKESTPKYNLPLLYKSILLPPIYNREGLDVNSEVRKKAAQFLYLIAVEDKELAKEIVETLSKTTIEGNLEREKIIKTMFLSKNAVDLLGLIGKLYPELVMDRFVSAIPKSDTLTKQYILDALGDVGELKKNITQVLEKVKPLMMDPKYEVRNAAGESLTEMIVEGSYKDKSFVNSILDVIYDVLETQKDNKEIIETTLEALTDICIKVPKDINIEKIVPFLDYYEVKENSNSTIAGYILQHTLYILGVIVYDNLDTFPYEKTFKLLEDSRNYIRYRAVDSLSNYILAIKDQEHIDTIVKALIKTSLEDQDPDVREISIESIAEFLIIKREYQVNIDGTSISILDYYIDALNSFEKERMENASEALKSIAPLYKENILSLLESKIQGSDVEVSNDLMHTLALVDDDIKKQFNLDILYQKTKSTNPITRSEAVFALGGMVSCRDDIDENVLLLLLNDEDLEVRLQAIFALGKLGLKKPDSIIPDLLERYFLLDKEAPSNISETELYAESLGEIGEKYPSSEIIISLQNTLMGDTNPYAKDVIARSLWMIGNGMIKSGNTTRRFPISRLGKTIAWLNVVHKKEYTIGNLVIMLIEALQQKGIPDSVMMILSYALQDLLPVFTFIKDEQERNQILHTIKKLLAQAYYSNYSQEILDSIDRVDALINFRNYFEVSDKKLKEQSLFYSMQYTSNGKIFYQQGKIFLELAAQDTHYLEYARESFNLAIQLSPDEFFVPNCLMAIGNIYQMEKNYEKANEKYKEALEIYAALDEIENMSKCEDKINEINAYIQSKN